MPLTAAAAARNHRRRTVGLDAELAQHFLGWLDRARALHARPAHEALGQEADQRRRDQERLDAHVDQTLMPPAASLVWTVENTR